MDDEDVFDYHFHTGEYRRALGTPISVCIMI